MKIRWARSATKHRISREQSRYVVEHCGLYFEQEAFGGNAVTDARLLFLGEDEKGVKLEVMAVELADDEVLVIHAMSMRSRYQEQYEEVRRWRR